ncbi:DUF4349 domain-containing protein [Amycolatopsis sp. CA-230715]|uniref:DUF4349 domain-containing protein n=1 Tax=Amycolatopsis sp. CA-230715 TaxID=2745196 RepID=UPI001C01714C|nr:DUF4349 domain-containing protein [Amycolatopsis sp. CA-230715]QWF79918.1 hypothetical protein HUW46_03331 [Amycolatopsis sp. CA-230715]
MITRRTRVVLACGVLAVALAGCTSGGQASRTADSGSGAQNEMAAPQAPSPGKAPAPGKPVAGQGQAEDRKLAKTATIALTAPDPAAAGEGARRAATAAGGFVGEERTDGDSASLSVSVPAAKLDSALDELAKLGTVVRKVQNAQDVTEQVVDVQSRLATQRKSVERVRALLDRAGSVSEIASVESELTTRETELEALQAKQNTLTAQVDMATISVSVSLPPASKPDSAPGGFTSGLADGWSAFLIFGSGVLTGLGAAAPFLALLLIPAALYWHHRRKKPASPTTPPPVTPTNNI